MKCILLAVFEVGFLAGIELISNFYKIVYSVFCNIILLYLQIIFIVCRIQCYILVYIVFIVLYCSTDGTVVE